MYQLLRTLHWPAIVWSALGTVLLLRVIEAALYEPMPCGFGEVGGCFCMFSNDKPDLLMAWDWVTQMWRGLWN